MSKIPFNVVKPTVEQERVLATARVAFMVASPFYAHLYHSIGREVITRDIGTLATDGRHIAINPDYFCALTVPEQVFTMAHEMSHLVCRHPQRMAHYHKTGSLKGKPVSQRFANICADYVINADLVETKVGAVNPDWLLRPDVTGDQLWEDVYERLWQDPPKRPKPPGKGRGEPCDDGTPGSQPGESEAEGSEPEHQPHRVKDDPRRRVFGKPDKQAEANGGAFDELLPPPVDPVSGEVDLPEEHEFQEAVARAAAVAKAIGKLPASIQRLVDEILAPQVDWRDHIRLLVTGKVGARGETWKRPNRRRLVLNPIMILPGKRGYGAETVVVGVDTSGSIGEKELAVFMAEVSGILSDVKPRRIVVIGCDAAVSQVDEVTSLDEFEGLREKGIKGGGGTRFEPVFDYVAEHDLRPETLIYLTDLLGSFPAEAPAYPVVWAATTDCEVPWGEVVRIKGD